LATQADFNAIMGPYSKMFLRNVRATTREGVIFDSGYTDSEVAEICRRLGVLRQLMEGNYQADVKKQDTSHTPVTLRVFCLFLVALGVPQHIADLYELHSAKFGYKSLKSGLYRGEARYNLGSGDPFTLIRNIFEVATVLAERYAVSWLKMFFWIIKGDDTLSTMLYPKFRNGSPIKEIRDTGLTENHTELEPRPPYHAGRFFLSDGVYPDPIRMVCKILAGQTDNKDRARELVQSFTDRYQKIPVSMYDEFMSACCQMYQDFSEIQVRAIFQLYLCFSDRSFLLETLHMEVNPETSLVRVDSSESCAEFAMSFFIHDDAKLRQFENLSGVEFSILARSYGVSTYAVPSTGGFNKPGIWYSSMHCWAVLPLWQVNFEIKKSTSQYVRNLRQGFGAYSCDQVVGVEEVAQPGVIGRGNHAEGFLHKHRAEVRRVRGIAGIAAGHGGGEHQVRNGVLRANSFQERH